MENTTLKPGEYWTITRLIYWYLDRHRSQQAERLARGLLELNGGDGLAWKYYGEARRQQGDLDGAVQSFGRATQFRPDDDEAWLRYGETLLRLGRRDEASQALEHARERTKGAGRRRRVDALLRLCGTQKRPQPRQEASDHGW